MDAVGRVLRERVAVADATIWASRAAMRRSETANSVSTSVSSPPSSMRKAWT